MMQDARVLVVDDDPDVRDAVAAVLQDDGYTVDTAWDGAEALRKVGEHEPDAIILERPMMPNMDGYEFLNLWRTRTAEQRTRPGRLAVRNYEQPRLARGAAVPVQALRPGLPGTALSTVLHPA